MKTSFWFVQTSRRVNGMSKNNGGDDDDGDCGGGSVVVVMIIEYRSVTS